MKAEVLEGLRRLQKALPSKLFYDARGSRLFDEITRLEEYYPTRTEVAIMEQYAGEMAASLGENCLLVELGSGSSTKAKLLLDEAPHLAAYVPVDISGAYLVESVARLQAEYPHLTILPVGADYTKPFTLPLDVVRPSRIVVYFPGSTIGNFTLEEAERFLIGIAEVCGPGGGLLIGVDLQKDPAVLEAAYNDSKGVTAAFNLNVLRRINRELGADFELSRFRHLAVYNEGAGRIEMYLESLDDQTVRVAGSTISFRKGEKIVTEYSYKYTLPQFARLAAGAGFAVQKVWLDERQFFSVQYLTVGS